MSGLRRIVVVGGSIAGAAAATALRELGFDGEVTVIGDEPHTPYARPPLSKALLRGDEPPEAAALAVTAEGVDWIRGTAATRLDTDAGRVHLEGGGHPVRRSRHRHRRAGTPSGRGRPRSVLLRALDDAAALSRAVAADPGSWWSAAVTSAWRSRRRLSVSACTSPWWT